MEADHLLNARIDMSLDDILNKPYGGGSGGGRHIKSRKFAAHSDSKPYARASHSSGPPPHVDFRAVTNRLYVNNLSYGTSWQDLKDHMRAAGNVVFTEVFSDQSGRSKRMDAENFFCSIVEFETRHEALTALKTLNDTDLGGRLIYLREDREDKHEPPPPRGGRSFGRDREPREAPHRGGGNAYETSWQDLKDIFRSCGNIIRADVLYGPDGRPKGTGVVLFESASDARRAIKQMDEADFNGRLIYVREDKFEGKI